MGRVISGGGKETGHKLKGGELTVCSQNWEEPRENSTCFILKPLFDTDSKWKCFVKYFHSRWHHLSTVGGVRWLEAFSFIKLSNNHLNGFHTLCSMWDTPTSMAGLPGGGENPQQTLNPSYLVFAFLFNHTRIFFFFKANLQIHFGSVIDYFGEKPHFCSWQQKSPFSFSKDSLVEYSFFT